MADGGRCCSGLGSTQCLLPHWQVSKTQKQTSARTKRFNCVQNTHSTHTTNWPVWWVCLQSGCCGTNCVWAQNEASVWMWGAGQDGNLRGKKELLCRFFLVKCHKYTLAIIICLTEAKKQLSTPPQCTWSMTVYSQKAYHWPLTTKENLLKSLKRPTTFSTSPSLCSMNQICITTTAPSTHTPSSLQCISKLIWLSREVKLIKILDGTQLWHNLCAMYNQPQPWVFRFQIQDRD